MNGFVYLMAEGVTDVMLLQRVLKRYFHMTQFKTLKELKQSAPQAAGWLAQFKWPQGGDISRLAVPAPVFFRGAEGQLVAIRNAQGITRMADVFELDNEALLRTDKDSRHRELKPDALGVFLDADDKTPQARFAEYQDKLDVGQLFPSLADLTAPEEVRRGDDGRAAGLFIFPDKHTGGTVDSLLLALGDAAFPHLSAHCAGFVDGWLEKHAEAPVYKDLRKPAGPTKARLSAMAALLKPGRNINASLQDHAWVPKEGDVPAVLQPLVDFLGDLLDAQPGSTHG